MTIIYLISLFNIGHINLHIEMLISHLNLSSSKGHHLIHIHNELNDALFIHLYNIIYYCPMNMYSHNCYTHIHGSSRLSLQHGSGYNLLLLFHFALID